MVRWSFADDTPGLVDDDLQALIPPPDDRAVLILAVLRPMVDRLDRSSLLGECPLDRRRQARHVGLASCEGSAGSKRQQTYDDGMSHTSS
jgi:hypothetical protein